MSLVAVKDRSGIVILTLMARHQANALSSTLLAELAARVWRAPDHGASAVVIAGDGATFSAGADLHEVTGTSADVALDDAVTRAGDAIGACPLPVIAAIEGPCIGAAVDLALACDVRVISETAYFAVPAVALGILYNPSALARMARRLPHQTLARLVLLGERISAVDAVHAGLAAHTVPAGQALDASLRLAFGALHGVPDARAATKTLLQSLVSGQFTAEDWQDVRHRLLTSAARAQRVRAAQQRSADSPPTSTPGR